jgi:glycosyltransferase involved in cell wall biosynthesis
MVSVYEAADIVLNTSEHEGGMANSLLEAMALGRPVLAADVTGNRSLVQDGVNGLLFKDASEMAEKAAMLLTDENLRQKLVTTAKEWVRQNCDPAEEAKRYLSIYERVSRWVRSAECNVQ